MVYVEVILAAFKAIPELIKGIRDLVTAVENSNILREKHLKEVALQTAMYGAHLKGDNHELEALLGKRFPPKP